MNECILNTGQHNCYDSQGNKIGCPGSGQDGENKTGLKWPSPRFISAGAGLVEDKATGLIWPENGNPFDFPITWREALQGASDLNRQRWLGRSDWRLPNRRELRSLIDHDARKPALPPDNLFTNVFLGWYWTSTSAAIAPSYAWYVHMEGGRMFYGEKSTQALFLPVSGISQVIPRTGQHHCYSREGKIIDNCIETGQDGDLRAGKIWPSPRFEIHGEELHDRLTGCRWYTASLAGSRPVSWQEALDSVVHLRNETAKNWRLPTINELESLVDASQHTPALPPGHHFEETHEGYWSSTTSFFEPDWAYVLYMYKGAVGVGYKNNRDFWVWAVR